MTSVELQSRGMSQAGFTLLEVLAALVIVALGMLGVIEAVSQTARNSAYVRDKTVAHWIAMNQLTRVRLEPQAPKVDKSADELEMGDRRWRWTMEVTQTPVESVRRIDIRVRLDETDEESSLASVTGFYGAAIAPAGTTQPVSWQSSQDGEPGGDNPGGQNDDDGKNQHPPKNPQPDPPEPTDPPMEDPPPEPSE